MSEPVFIALGSNLEDPRAQVQRCIDAIRLLPYSTLLRVSPFYETAPMGYTEQDPFINAVVLIETTLEPLSLLSHLQSIEKSQGRVREIKNGPRTIDCDIVLFGSRVIQSEALTVPHPGLTTRDFVLKPLLDIAPECVLPNGQKLSEAFKHVAEKFVIA